MDKYPKISKSSLSFAICLLGLGFGEYYGLCMLMWFSLVMSFFTGLVLVFVLGKYAWYYPNIEKSTQKSQNNRNKDNIAKCVILALIAITSISCTPEQIKDLADKISGNEANFSGSYALDDGSGLTNTYISFSKGKLYEYRRTDKVVLAENYIWYANSGDFSLARSGEYSVGSGILYCNGVPCGKIQITDVQMTLDGKSYQKIYGLKDERYTSISVGETFSRQLSYQRAEVQIPVSVSKTIPSGKIIVQSSTYWLTGSVSDDSTLLLSVTENNTGSSRNASITLSYPGAANITLSFYQGYASSSITCEPISQEVGYVGGKYFFSFSVADLRELGIIQIDNQNNWITDITSAAIGTSAQAEGNVVSYTVAENSSIYSRTGYLTVKYGTYSTSYASRSFTITQKGSPVQSLTLDRAEMAMTVGASQTLYATVRPSDAALSWSSTNMAVATVTQSGLVKAIGNGTSTIVVQSSDGKKSATCEVTVTTPVTGVTLDASALVLVKGKSRTLTATVKPTTASNPNVSWYSTNSAVVSVNQSGTITAISPGLATVKVTTRDGSFVAECAVGVISADQFVDLGLSVHWASCNLGASEPAASGDYYAWGETEPYYSSLEPLIWKNGKSSGYDWSSYKWCNGTASTLTKYNVDANLGIVDGKTILETGPNGDDVASKQLGGRWRMPTNEELHELIDNCTASWTALDGVTGYLFTSNKAGYTNSSIFLPAAGDWTTTSLNSESTNGSYWTSSLRSSKASSSAWRLGMSSGFVDNGNFDRRCLGQSVRPVYEYSPAPITSLAINPATLSLDIGKSTSLSYTVYPLNTTADKSVNWSSSNTSVATVSSSGIVTGVASGIATITATANDGSGMRASCIVYVAITDLSSSKSANCYIVASAGGYKFKTVKGNSSTSVGGVSKAEVLWESFGTSTAPSKGAIISSVSYASNCITFTTPSTLKNGNAVIAAKDASGNILWSWHIWVCSGYNPASTAQTYYYSAGTMMDRNLGATSATPGDVGALGLLYQWGRKDPFLGSSSISSNTKAASTLSWPSTVSSNSSNGTIAYSVAHPTTFITYNSSNYDWYYTGSSSTDNTRWQTSKTIYDPCPPGWRVPDGGSSGVWSKAAGSSSYFSEYPYDSTNKGMNFSGKFGSASTIWYPAAGSLLSVGGSLYGVGSFGYWWSYTPSGTNAYLLYLYSGGNVTPSGSEFLSDGLSVRCLQE